MKTTAILTVWRRLKPSGVKGVVAWTLSAGAVAALALAVSCASVTRTVMVTPKIPGATVVGMDQCATCHEKMVADFKTATHARLQAEGPNAKDTALGCEACHGGGSKHVEAGGGRGTMVNPKKSPEVCFQCHVDKRGEFSLPHTHPVLAGKVSCNDCHDPHQGNAVKAGGTALAAQNETCFKCHAAQRGPFVREHEALREGCTTCHAPHGSVNAKMLTSRNATVCLACHAQQETKNGRITIGGRDHAGSMARGTCWSAGCHEAVHGSQVNSSLRF